MSFESSENFSKEVIERICTLVEVEGVSFVKQFASLMGAKCELASVKSSVNNLLELCKKHSARLSGKDRPLLDADEKVELSNVFSAMAACTGFAQKWTNTMDDRLLELQKKEAAARVALREMEVETLETILAKLKLGVDVWEGFDDGTRDKIIDKISDAELLKMREVRMS